MAEPTHRILNMRNHVQIRLEENQDQSLRSLKVRLILEISLDIPFDIHRHRYSPSPTKLRIHAWHTTGLTISEVGPNEISHRGRDTVQEKLFDFLDLCDCDAGEDDMSDIHLSSRFRWASIEDSEWVVGRDGTGSVVVGG